MRGETGLSCTISQSKSRQPGAVTSARRTAVPTASGVNPSSCAPSGSACAHGGGDRGGIRFDRQAVHGGIDVVERTVGLEEEVAGEAEFGDPAVALFEVDDDQLASGHLVFAVHETQLKRARAGSVARGEARVEPGEQVGAHLLLPDFVEDLVPRPRVHEAS